MTKAERSIPLASRRRIFRGGKRGNDRNYVLVIHGGAGTMKRENSTPEQHIKYRTELTRALKAGHEVLKLGGEAMDAVVAAVSVLEDCPLFNSGKGAVFNVAGKNELEASLMLSKTPSAHPAILPSRRGSSVTLLTRTRNPSTLVRALYLAPGLAPHPMLSGAAVETLGEEHLGVQTVDPSYFWTEARWKEHRVRLGLPVEDSIEGPPSETQRVCPSDDDADSVTSTRVGSPDPSLAEVKVAKCASLSRPCACQSESVEEQPIDLMPMGTVGAVALDVRGCIATLTSTGGRTNKLVGRIGDTPIMGSGFWAEEWQRRKGGFWERTWNRLTGRSTKCGVGISGTGDGDYFIRHNAASTIAHRMQYLDEPLKQATSYVVKGLFEDGGLGGVIAVDRQGNVALPLNCSGMYRGVIHSNGVALTAIFADDELSEL